MSIGCLPTARLSRQIPGIPRRTNKLRVGGHAYLRHSQLRGRPPASLTRPSAPTFVMTPMEQGGAAIIAAMPIVDWKAFVASVFSTSAPANVGVGFFCIVNVSLCRGFFHKMQVGGRAVPKCTIKRGRPPASLTRPSAPTSVSWRGADTGTGVAPATCPPGPSRPTGASPRTRRRESCAPLRRARQTRARTP